MDEPLKVIENKMEKDNADCEVGLVQEKEEKVQVKENEKEDEEERFKWTNKREYILATLGYCVGIGNVWRFPYICIRNGGGAFLIPFFLSLVLFGLPLFFLESAMGQFTSRSAIHVWSVCPLAKGLGFAMCLTTTYVFWYYNTILTWTLYYLANSFRSVLPWAQCGQWWNTDRCQVLSLASDEPVASTINATGLSSNISTSVSEDNNYTMSAMWNLTEDISWALNGTLNITGNTTQATKVKYVSASEEFWQHNVLQVSSGFEEPGHLVWYLVLCLAIAGLLVFFAMIKGIKSSGKVVYVTATAPYILLTILLVRGVTLPGAEKGILFYLTPDFEKLADSSVWMEAALQVFWSLGPCWGCIITFASYNKFNNNCLRDSIFLTFVSEGTSFYAGFVIFSVLGYMAHEFGLSVDEVVSTGPGLTFIVYPEAISLMPLPQLWAVLFFLMIVSVCYDSEIAHGECVLTILSDFFPHTFHRHRALCTGILCFITFLLQLPLVTQGGIYLYQLVDWYIAAFTVMLIGAIECIVLGWVYGIQRFGRDIEQMLGRQPPMVMKVLWCAVTPSLLLVMWALTLARYKAPNYGDYTFGPGANVFGWIIAVSTFVPIPVVAIYQLAKSKGSLREDGVSAHAGKPFALHHTNRALQRRLAPGRCLKAYTKSIRTRWYVGTVASHTHYITSIGPVPKKVKSVGCLISSAQSLCAYEVLRDCVKPRNPPRIGVPLQSFEDVP